VGAVLRRCSGPNVCLRRIRFAQPVASDGAAATACRGEDWFCPRRGLRLWGWFASIGQGRDRLQRRLRFETETIAHNGLVAVWNPAKVQVDCLRSLLVATDRCPSKQNFLPNFLRDRVIHYRRSIPREPSAVLGRPGCWRSGGCASSAAEGGAQVEVSTQPVALAGFSTTSNDQHLEAIERCSWRPGPAG